MSSRLKRYGLAVLITAVAWLGDVLLRERFALSSGGLYVAAALVSTWIGGLGPGLLSMTLTAAINLIFYDRPYMSLAVGVHGFDRLIFFTVLALFMSLIRRHQTLLKEVNSKLEEKVGMRTAALNESNQQLEAFCYTLAHDLRAPLRAIQGFADMVITDGTGLDQQSKMGMERIRNSAERMGRLILDLLAYTDLTRADFRRQPVDLEGACRNVLRTFSDEIVRTKAEVTVDLAARRVSSDPEGVERVLVNLVENALKFARPGKPPVIRIFSERRDGDIRVSVADNGIGIDPKYRDRIFGVFERLSPTGSSADTGIGLPIAKRSVEKMGGKMGVESTLGEGSCFWFELPEAQEPVAPKPGTQNGSEHLFTQHADKREEEDFAESARKQKGD